MLGGKRSVGGLPPAKVTSFLAISTSSSLIFAAEIQNIKSKDAFVHFNESRGSHYIIKKGLISQFQATFEQPLAQTCNGFAIDQTTSIPDFAENHFTIAVKITTAVLIERKKPALKLDCI